MKYKPSYLDKNVNSMAQTLANFTEQQPFQQHFYSKQQNKTCINGNQGTFKEKFYIGSGMRIQYVKSN